jgi:hypothetical protein
MNVPGSGFRSSPSALETLETTILRLRPLVDLRKFMAEITFLARSVLQIHLRSDLEKNNIYSSLGEDLEDWSAVDGYFAFASIERIIERKPEKSLGGPGLIPPVIVLLRVG